LAPVQATQIEMAMDGGGVYPNMLTAHPPMQIDANFGYGAALLDMLVRAEKNEIFLLPALPTEWVSGTLQGFRLPGGGTLDVEWDEMTVCCKVTQENRAGTKIFHKCNETLVALTTGPIEKFSFPQNPTHAGNAV